MAKNNYDTKFSQMAPLCPGAKTKENVKKSKPPTGLPPPPPSVHTELGLGSRASPTSTDERSGPEREWVRGEGARGGRGVMGAKYGPRAN